MPSRFRLRRLRPDVPTRYTVRLVFYRYESEIFSHISTPAAGGVQAGRRADEEGTSDKRRRSSDDGSTFGPRREQLCLILPLLAAQWSVISLTSRREESRIK